MLKGISLEPHLVPVRSEHRVVGKCWVTPEHFHPKMCQLWTRKIMKQKELQHTSLPYTRLEFCCFNSWTISTTIARNDVSLVYPLRREKKRHYWSRFSWMFLLFFGWVGKCIERLHFTLWNKAFLEQRQFSISFRGNSWKTNSDSPCTTSNRNLKINVLSTL